MRIINIIKPNPLHITQFTFRKLPGIRLKLASGDRDLPDYWMIQDESLLKIYCESTYLGIKIKYAMVYEQVKENIAGKNGIKYITGDKSK